MNGNSVVMRSNNIFSFWWQKMANQVKTNYGQNRFVHDEIAVDKRHLVRKQRVMNESKTIQFLNDKSHAIRNLFDRIF